MTTSDTTSDSRPGGAVVAPRISPYDAVWLPRDGLPLDLIGRAVSVLLISYIVLNRLISDRFVLPVGASIRAYELLLVLLGLVWALWMIREPHPFPTGVVGLFGLAGFVVIGLAPFVNALTLTSFQANGAERGLLRLFIFTTLFLASFHLAFRRREGFRIVAWVLAATAFQAVFAVYEFVTKKPVVLLDDIALSFGMIPDPRSIRQDLDGVFVRLSGEIRAVTTAPHPIVLSAVLALGALVAATWLLYARRGRGSAWLAFAAMLIVLALPVTNSRTAFVMLAVALVPFTILHVRRLPRIVIWALPALLAMGLAFAISPGTPRLLLNSVTNPQDDQNTQVRVERFSRVPELLEEHPLVGAGYLTHDVKIQIFDNAYNLALVEFGIIGFSLFLLFLLAVLVRCWTATYRAEGIEIVLPAVGAIAVIALLAGGGTFDAWTFDQFLPTVLILMGVGLGRSAVILHRDRPSSSGDVEPERGIA